MALRTRVFSALLRISEKGIEDVVDLPAHRAKRAKLQRSPVGRFVFGRPDRRAAVEEITVGTGARALVHRPTDAVAPLPCVLNFHGGGWVQGNPEQSGWLASRIAVRNRAVVISPSYRLAPEQPFPSGVEDCWETLTWVVEHADELGVDPERVAVMGDSAGGNLAAVMALLARDAGAPELRAQVLIYPGTEMYDRWPSEDRNADAPVLTSKNMGRSPGSTWVIGMATRTSAPHRSAPTRTPDCRRRSSSLPSWTPCSTTARATATRSWPAVCRCAMRSTTERSTAS
jgi:acetyl esterase